MAFSRTSYGAGRRVQLGLAKLLGSDDGQRPATSPSNSGGARQSISASPDEKHLERFRAAGLPVALGVERLLALRPIDLVRAKSDCDHVDRNLHRSCCRMKQHEPGGRRYSGAALSPVRERRLPRRKGMAVAKIPVWRPYGCRHVERFRLWTRATPRRCARKHSVEERRREGHIVPRSGLSQWKHRRGISHRPAERATHFGKRTDFAKAGAYR